MKTLLNACKVRSCQEVHVEDSELCAFHYEKAKRISLETEIKRLRIKMATLERRNLQVSLGYKLIKLGN